MKGSLSAVFRHLSEDLIAPDAAASLGQFASLLPPVPLTIFESRVGNPRAAVDYLVCVEPTWILNPKVTGLISADERWGDICHFGKKWANSSTSDLFRRAVDSVWLEFDTSQTLRQVMPGIFFASLEAQIFQSSYADHCQAIHTAFAHLPYLANNSDVKRQLQRCLDWLPEEARIYALGDLNGRSVKQLRVAIARVPIRKLPRFLSDIAWPGDYQVVDALIRQVAPDVSALSIDLDIGDGVLPQIGLEFTNPNRFQRQWWQEMLARLVDAGFCLPARRNALLEWQGYTNETANPDVWPNDLVKTDHLVPPIYCLIVRFINHLKVVYKPDQPIEAKAYFAAKQVCTDRRQLSNHSRSGSSARN